MSALNDGQLGHLRGLVDWPDVSNTRYTLLEKVAVGGMGTVYRAHDHSLDRIVAFKVLTIPDEAGSLAARMIREAKVVAQLEHPGIVPIHDVGRLEDGRVFYAMKYVEGQTLEQASDHIVSMNGLLRIVQKICEAVEFAHSRGIVHRDLKPSNIMVGQFGEVLVMDWGIAGLAEAENSPTPEGSMHNRGDTPARERTADGVVMGTPGYMSPEQASGWSDRVDKRTDIYGIGAILYYCLTQRPPTIPDSNSPADSGTEWSIVPPRVVRRSIPRPVEAICLCALAVEPSNRYPSAEQLSQDISRYLDGHPILAYPENLFERAGRWMARNRFIVVMVVAYLIVRLILLFWRGI